MLIYGLMRHVTPSALKCCLETEIFQTSPVVASTLMKSLVTLRAPDPVVPIAFSVVPNAGSLP